MKVVEILVTLLVPDEAGNEAVRELVGGAVSEQVPADSALLDVSYEGHDTVTDEEAAELTA